MASPSLTRDRSAPAPSPRIHIRPDDRVCFFGTTGSGKTTMIRRLLGITRRWVFLDPKYGFAYPNVPINETFDDELDRQIIRLPEGESETPEAWSAAIRAAYNARNIVIVIDELTAVTPRTAMTPALGWTIRTGRQRNVGVWSASQRPKEIPSGIFTEAQHFFVFSLAHRDDREKVINFTTDAIEEAMTPYHPDEHPDGLKKHDAVYYRVGGDWMILRA